MFENNGKQILKLGEGTGYLFDLYIANLRNMATSMRVNGYHQWQTYIRDDFSAL